VNATATLPSKAKPTATVMEPGQDAGPIIDVETATPRQTQLKPAEPTDDGDTDGDEGEPGPLYDYAVLFKNGHVTNHQDERTPEELAFDYKLCLLYPLTPRSAFSDEEWDRFEALQKEDPRRYQKKDARLYVFQIGLGTGDDDEGEQVELLDPREIQAIVGADSFGPPAPMEDDDQDGGDDDDEDAPSGPSHGRRLAPVNRINGPDGDLGPRRGRKALRDRLGK